MTAHTFATSTTMVTEECCNCGVLFAMTQEFIDRKREQAESSTFYCPNGHPQHYLGKSLKDQLKEAKRRTESAEENARLAWQQHDIEYEKRKELQREANLARRRAQAALCPVPGCKKRLQNLDRHLHTVHPEFVHEPEGKLP